MNRMISAALLLSLCSGCYMSRVTAPGFAGTKHDDTGFSLFWGITRTDQGAVECTAGMKEVTHYWPWYAPVLQLITLGIVSPIKREYTCIAPTATPIR